MQKKLAILAIAMMTAFTSFAPAQAFPTAAITTAIGRPDVQQVRDGDRPLLRRDNHRYYDRYDRRERYGDYRRYDRRYDRRDRRSNAGAIIGGLAAGAIIGGVIASQSRSGNSCASRYRSYRASDNTYQPNSGPRRVCR